MAGMATLGVDSEFVEKSDRRTPAIHIVAKHVAKHGDHWTTNPNQSSGHRAFNKTEEGKLKAVVMVINDALRG